MRKKENNSIGHSVLLRTGLFNGIKNSLKKFSKKSLGKVGLFLVFGIIFFNLNFGVNAVTGSQNNFLKIKFDNVKAAEDIGEVLLNNYDSSGTGQDPTNKDGVNNRLPGGNMFTTAIVALLNGVNVLLSKLVLFAGFLMDATLKKDFFDAMVNNEGVYDGWVIVRDVLNMFFMLILLFSAFATIFQVEQYHLRKMIIMLVVMALLVNFSFPITRFIIDFSNSIMYFMVDSISVQGQSNSAHIARFSEFGDALAKATDMSNSIVASILNIILTFIVFITIFGIALNLLLRIIYFVILIILSPVGFVFAFFPGTKKIANEWWDTLFKYAFMGPVMIFFFYLAVLMFDRSGDAVKSDNPWVVSFVKFFIPTVFLWVGLMTSQKFGGSGSAMAMKLAKDTGNKIKGYGQKAAWGTVGMVGKGVDTATGHRISGGIGGLKSKWDSYGENYKSKSNTRKTQAADFLGVKGANEKLVQENRKKWKEAGGVSDSEMARIDSKRGTKAEKMALALERAENKGFDKDPVKAAAQYQEALNALKGNKVYKDLFDGNVRKKNIDLEITANISEEMTRQGRSLYQGEVETIAKKSFDKLEPGDWKDQNVERMVATNRMYGHDGVADAAKARIRDYKKPDKVTENMRGNKYDAGRGIFWV